MSEAEGEPDRYGISGMLRGSFYPLCPRPVPFQNRSPQIRSCRISLARGLRAHFEQGLHTKLVKRLCDRTLWRFRIEGDRFRLDFGAWGLGSGFPFVKKWCAGCKAGLFVCIMPQDPSRALYSNRVTTALNCGYLEYMRGC